MTNANLALFKRQQHTIGQIELAASPLDGLHNSYSLGFGFFLLQLPQHIVCNLPIFALVEW